MINYIAGLVTIFGGGVFGTLSVYAMIDNTLPNLTRIFMVFALLILAFCSIFSGLKLLFP